MDRTYLLMLSRALDQVLVKSVFLWNQPLIFFFTAKYHESTSSWTGMFFQDSTGHPWVTYRKRSLDTVKSGKEDPNVGLTDPPKEISKDRPSFVSGAFIFLSSMKKREIKVVWGLDGEWESSGLDLYWSFSPCQLNKMIFKLSGSSHEVIRSFFFLIPLRMKGRCL